jgi:hypothetical protein
MNTGECAEILGFVPEFVSALIKSGLSAYLREIFSFNDISEALKKNYFKIVDGVDFNKFSAFINLVEFSET